MEMFLDLLKRCRAMFNLSFGRNWGSQFRGGRIVEHAILLSVSSDHVHI